MGDAPPKARKRHLNGRLRVFHWDGISVENEALLSHTCGVSIKKCYLWVGDATSVLFLERRVSVKRLCREERPACAEFVKIAAVL